MFLLMYQYFYSVVTSFVPPWIVCVFFLLTVTVIFGLYCWQRYRRRYWSTSCCCKSVKVCVPLGSGGHTTEILRLVSHLCEVYNHRVYILAESDRFSEAKLLEVEKYKNGTFEVYKIPRSREVGQSYLASFFTTLLALASCIPVMWKLRVDLVVCNGPGTCIPICALAFLLDLFYVKECKIVFIESICRVRSLSLSGEILYWSGVADKVLVQWPKQKEIYSGVEYIGRL